MGVARVSALVLFASGLIAIAVLLAPEVGLWRHRRACTWISMGAAAAAAAVLALQVVVPMARGLVFAWPGDYYLAMAHSINPNSPYPFFWSPAWEYALGRLTPLIAAGGVLALGTGYPALRAGTRVAALPISVGACAVVAYVVGAAFAAMWSWHGVPV